MRTRVRAGRQAVLLCASLLLVFLVLLAACSGSTGTTTTLTTPATATELATATASATLQPTATNTLTPKPTATPTTRPAPTATSTPRPRPTPTATSRPTATATKSPTATPTPKPQTVMVNIKNFAFSPQSLTIHVGDTVKWTNMDSLDHTTTSDSLVWDSKDLATNATFSFTFTTPGTYTYHCAIHPFMTGTITVTS